MARIQITSSGIKKALKKYDYVQAIGEYVWNGFDAGASQIEIEVESNEMGNISSFRVKDNGYGIPKDKLSTKFVPVFESDRAVDPYLQRTTSAFHGKNGVGRLTFFKFALEARWQTTFRSGQGCFEYEITISSDTLNTYSASEPREATGPTGTTVSFSGIHTMTFYDVERDVRDYLTREFGWFLELNAPRQFALLVNGQPLDYGRAVKERDFTTFIIDGSHFDVRYVQWSKQMNREYSRYYYIDSMGKERYKATTTLNNKGDHFFHSVFVTSSYFDSFVSPSSAKQSDDGQLSLFRSDTTKELEREIDQYLRYKRKPFLRRYGDHLIAEYEKTGVFPKFGPNPWDTFRKQELENLVRELYQVEPKLFSNLNLEQKKTFVYFLNLIMDDEQRDKLFDVLSAIVDLDVSEREQLAGLLRSSRLSNIIKTIKLIEDRYRAIEELKRLVFDRDLVANERDHLQPFMERHYWYSVSNTIL